MTISVQAQDGFTKNSSLELKKKKELNWVSSYKKAVRLSRKKDKALLIFFTGSDWCGFCKSLEKHFLSSEDFIEIAEKDLILYKADFPHRTDIITKEERKVNDGIKKKFSVSGYPTILIVSPNGKVLGKRSGFGFDHDTQYHFKLVRKAIEKHNNQ